MLRRRPALDGYVGPGGADALGHKLSLSYDSLLRPLAKDWALLVKLVNKTAVLRPKAGSPERIAACLLRDAAAFFSPSC